MATEKPKRSLRDAWDTSRDENKPDEEPFNPANFIVPPKPKPEALPPLEDEEGTRNYITTHTPHAWLDRYIEYSRELSPRAFDMLHEAAGLWALSSAVAKPNNVSASSLA